MGPILQVNRCDCPITSEILPEILRTTCTEGGIDQVKGSQKYKGSLPFRLLARGSLRNTRVSTLPRYKEFLSHLIRLYLQNTFKSITSLAPALLQATITSELDYCRSPYIYPCLAAKILLGKQKSGHGPLLLMTLQ